MVGRANDIFWVGLACISHDGSMGLLYLHRSSYKNQRNAGRYTIHGSHGYNYMQNVVLQLFTCTTFICFLHT